MSVYSGTFTPTRGPDVPTEGDPIVQARESLRQAARAPFSASRPMAWHGRFRELVLRAQSQLSRHIVNAQMPGSPWSELRPEPRLQHLFDRQRDEHQALVCQAQQLVDGVEESADIDIWRMIDLSEKAILLEIALARHHNRLVRMVYESTGVELDPAG